MAPSRILLQLTTATAVVLAGGCPPPPPPPPPPVIVKLGTVSDFFLDLGAERTSIFGLPIEPIDTLKTRAHSGSGKKRREAMTHLVYAHLREAEKALDARASRRHLNAASRIAKTVGRSTRDRRLDAEMAKLRREAGLQNAYPVNPDMSKPTLPYVPPVSYRNQRTR